MRFYPYFKSAFCAFVLGAFSAAASAAPVVLTCTYVSGNGGAGDVRVTLDESASTAVFGDDPVSHANFTDTMVAWGEVDTTLNTPGAATRYFHSNYSLSRDTGTLTMTGTWMDGDNEEGRPWHTRSATYHCVLEHKLF